MMRSQAPRILAAALLASSLTAGAQPASITDALDLYERGGHAAAIDRVDGARVTTGALIAEAERWMAAAPREEEPRRTLVAATFVLDLAWTSTRHDDNAFSTEIDWRFALSDWEAHPLSTPGAAVPIVAWACLQVSAGEAGAAERWWWLASVGVLEDARAWDVLLGTDNRGHLFHARERFPDEPRWRLAEVLARGSDRLGPSDRTERRADVLRDERHPRSGLLAGVRREFEALARDVPSLAGEAFVHAGYLDLLARRWRAALDRFERARPLIDEPFLLVTLDYFSGWARERLGETAEALAAYRRAHERAPGVRNLTTLLAAQLYLANERTAAYAVLDEGFSATPAPFDLRTRLERGSARLVPEYLTRLREALR